MEKPPVIVTDKVDEFHKLYLNKDLLPGLVTVTGGQRGNNYRLTQEPRTFRTHIYYSGFTVPYWRVVAKIWTEEQWLETVRIYNKYVPNPVRKLSSLTAVQVTNYILNQNGYRMMIINDWEPMTKPVNGSLFTYSFKLIQYFSIRFVPKPAKKKDNNASTIVDVDQWKEAQIEPPPEFSGQNQSYIDTETWWQEFDKAQNIDNFDPMKFYIKDSTKEEGDTGVSGQ